MALYGKFGEFDSADRLNELAENLLKEGDKASIKALALPMPPRTPVTMATLMT